MIGLAAEFQAARADTALAVLEGFHTIKHALRFDAEVLRIAAADPDALEALAGDLAPDLRGVFRRRAVRVTDDQLGRLTTRVPTTRVVAVARRRPGDPTRILTDPSARPAVLIENPRHSGNLGAVVRVAAAADVAGVLTTGEVDPWNPAALRGSAGLHYAVPVTRLPKRPDSHPDLSADLPFDLSPDLPPTLEARPLVVVDPDGAPLDAAHLPDRPLLAFGTERHGLSAALRQRATVAVRIPMRAGVSSLNLATAVAVVLYQARPG